ncbi:type II toxin-antitoxin system VapC family toxin [Halobaculum sp. MBLA0143]|uniref:type II toxin-antitoxin system VapC family toxin n=1 Tax=Halobaculum sp. MBLA0143 TaxID=3079933 RepID=UPI0035243B92
MFDAEPLIAHADDELGAEYVAKLLNAVESGDRGGYASQTTIAEVRCVLARNHDRALRRVPRLARHHRCRTGRHRRCLAADCRYVLRYSPALGDAVALATAERLGAVLVVGGDDDYDEVADVPLERFRDGAD